MADELKSMKDWIANKQTNSRVTPAKKDKVFETKVKVSADPQHETVAKILQLISVGSYLEAYEVAAESDAPEFLGEFAKDVANHGGNQGLEDGWIFVRKIRSGAKGRTAPVKVELSEGKVVDVPKSMIYAVDGRKWRKIGIDNLLPSITTTKTFGAEDPLPGMLGGAKNPPTDVNSGTGAKTPEDNAPPIATHDELIALIGAESVETLNRLGLRSGVKIADFDIGTFKIINGKSQTPVRIIGKKELEVSQVIRGSNFGPIDGEGNYTAFTPANMGSAIAREFNSLLEDNENKDNREVMVEQLREIRKHSDGLSKVFGFDDPEQLEAFFCAWLMEDSTCRLTGIPGTGKTTVINSAATLLSNSYGYNVGERYLKDLSIGGDFLTFPAGQDYNVNYGDKRMQKTYSMWDDWRFSEWKLGEPISGSYLYDFSFLQRTSDSGYEKSPMDAEDFATLLFAKNVNDKVVSSPIKYADLDKQFGGNAPNSFSKDKGGNAILHDGTPLYNDAGGNEGFYFREFLMEHFYDRRLDMKSSGMGLISDEMLNECGVAKIDYDKRAEEILYGIEIRQITDEQIVGGKKKSVAAYQFDPTPRKVVTQPIKFFNEANRSGSGVEDAILGLIAEKTVEYRGQTFKSPSFIAWMDTNPHQKGNDLAFVDRIDMELYFGTLSLGGRFNTLVERYGGKGTKGSRPELQLIQGMLLNKGDSGFIKPMRFHDLKETWDTIKKMPFNASGASAENTGALLDISMLSVLFTQRFMGQNLVTTVLGTDHHFADGLSVYTSPLADISTTTNSQYEGIHTTDIDVFKGSDSTHAPVLIKRMLGFRFSNSLIKMTRAMAFLRGKDHVTRQEVIDAMPYCLGHRLGPAREGEDPKGRDIGIEREGMTVANEQVFVKEIIMEGYVLRNTESLMGKVEKTSLLDLWDAFRKTCKINIDSTDAYWKYEKSILLNMKKDVRTASTELTPVHWSIGTMVVENKRRSDVYKSLYSSYQERIQRPASKQGTKDTSEDEQKAQLLGNTSAAQYMKVRGDIAGEPFLFSDDKDKLLSLVDSKIDSICGIALPMGEVDCSNLMAIAPTVGTAYELGKESYSDFDNSIGGESATKFPWRCYGDAMGAWGGMVTGGNNVVKPMQLGVVADVSVKMGATLASNQTVSVNQQIQIPPPASNVEDGQFINKIDLLLNSFDGFAENGVHIGKLKTPGEVGIISKFVDIDDFRTNVKVFLNHWIAQNAKNPKECAKMMTDGYNACFRLSHRGVVGVDSMTVTLKDGSVKDIEGDDELRLWLSLRCIQGDNKKEGSTATISFFAGVTSACMKPKDDVGSVRIDTPQGNPTAWEILPFEEDDTYNAQNYGGSDHSDSLYQDIGNMTTSDYRLYEQSMLNSISNDTV